FEHVPQPLRERFLRESFRVGSRGAIHAFPVATADNQLAEDAAHQVCRKLFGRGFRWLDEHQREGLPEIDRALAWATAITPHVVTFSGSSLGFWLPMMKLHFIKEARRELAPLVRALDRYYNEQLFATDRGEPSYRRFIVLLK